MTATQPWALFCNHGRQPYERTWPCRNVWVAREVLVNEWQARLHASREGWTCHEFDGALMQTPTDYCPDHAGDAADPPP